ncbi:DnaB-like helicase C-terminal domain-containing protein [Candidatus Vidania fulgoroideorum]
MNVFFCPEIEKAFLACVVYNNNLLKKTNIKYNDFYLKENKVFFKIINKIFVKFKEINPVNIRLFLEKKKTIISNKYLEDIYNANYCYLNFKKYVKIIKKKNILRRYYIFFQNMSNNIKIGKIRKIDEIFLISKKKIEKLKCFFINSKKKSTILSTKNVLKNVLYKKKEKYYKTGFNKLDKLILGLKPGEIYIIAGRPSTGKTSFCVSIAEYIAFKKKKAVLFFSLEMTIKQLIIRLLSSISNINSYKILNNMLNKEEILKIIKNCRKISNSNIFINDNPYINVLDICSEIKRNIPNGGVVFIDYIQLINVGKGKENRNLEITEISYHLKNVSKRMKIPIILISQLNRSIELRSDKTPIMSDLRESGSLEQDADLIIFLNKKIDDDKEKHSLINFVIGKNRNGPLGNFDLKFDKTITKFFDE